MYLATSVDLLVVHIVHLVQGLHQCQNHKSAVNHYSPSLKPFLGKTGHMGRKQKIQLKIKVRFIVKQQTLHIHQTGRLKRKGVRNKQELWPNLQTNSYGTAKVHTLNLLECFHRLYNFSLKSVQKHGQPGQISTEAPHLVRRRDTNAPNNMYKNRKCKEKYKQILRLC